MQFKKSRVWVGLSILALTLSGCIESKDTAAPPAANSRGPAPAAGGGAQPYELAAADWLNTESPPTLAALKGQVLAVEFWATWCGPCVAGIPHLNELQTKYRDRGLKIVSFTDEDRGTVDEFQKRAKSPIEYTVGVGSDLSAKYGVNGIPHALLINRGGKIIWQGHPADPAFEEQIEKALEEK